MFFIPIVAGLFYKKKTTPAAMACIIYSAILYVVWEFILGCPAGLPTSIVVSVTGAILYFIVCNATYKKDGERLDPDSLTEV